MKFYGSDPTRRRFNQVNTGTNSTSASTSGGGLLVFVQEHVGLKGDVRYYHSFEALDLLGIDLARDRNKVDFGRAALGVLFKF